MYVEPVKTNGQEKGNQSSRTNPPDSAWGVGGFTILDKAEALERAKEWLKPKVCDICKEEVDKLRKGLCHPCFEGQYSN